VLAYRLTPPQTNYDCKNPLENSHLNFWDQYSILLIDYLPKGQTINIEYHSSLLVQLKGILKEKCRAMKRSPGTCNPEETGLPGLPMS
jgi:hypothetical protein